MLVKDYVPHAANATSYSENAKMSLLVEQLLFYMWTDNRLTASETLTAAVEKGIAAREAKATGDARRKDKGQTGEERDAKVVLEMSAERIRMLMGMWGRGRVLGEVGLESSSQLTDEPLTETEEDGDDDMVV